MKPFIVGCWLFFSLALFSQNLQSPSTFLGYDLGSQFSRHHEVVAYFTYLAKAAPERVQLMTYGSTYERRPLVLAIVSSEANIKNLESIRKEHLKALSGSGDQERAIVWLSYNVHGNESSGTEAAMQTIYTLLSQQTDYLENTIVLIDPCVNPDGRDRYSNWYHQFKNTPYQLDPNSKEHQEGWWSGRSNHYMFDLNRDWAWLTQKESRQRLKQYNQWMPHVHVDFHEQGVNDPYYFAPAAEPYHEVVTDFQRNFQETMGRNHAKYFDANGWYYFTKERFDLFYPSYGDTYPTYNGSIGMTYEQGGSGRAGLATITQNGDTLTLKDRIDHHMTTGLSTIEVAANNIATLNQAFKNFFSNKDYTYKSYVLAGNQDHLKSLTKLLDQHQIQYGWAKNNHIKGWDYNKSAKGQQKIGANHLVVHTDQARGTLVKVLLEPNAKLSDSLTYDITAWSLPYAYGLNAMASTQKVATTPKKEAQTDYTITNQDAYAYIGDWDSMEDARFLAHLLQKGIKVKTSYSPFSLAGNTYQEGSLIITKADNQQLKNYTQILNDASQQFKKQLHSVNSGFVDSGKDFGSPHVKTITTPKIAVLSGEPTTSLRFGEVWHFFEQQLQYPITVLDAAYFNTVDLDHYDVLILPGGPYRKQMPIAQWENLKKWVSQGGKLIAMGGAVKALTKLKGFGISPKAQKEATVSNELTAHNNQQRERIKNAITGAIFKAKVDNSNPLAYGYGPHYFTLKTGANAFAHLPKGNVVYLEEKSLPFAGFAGSKAQERIKNSLIFGVEKMEQGQVVYFADNPLFRGFWENGKLFFANALFMVR